MEKIKDGFNNVILEKITESVELTKLQQILNLIKAHWIGWVAVPLLFAFVIFFLGVWNAYDCRRLGTQCGDLHGAITWFLFSSPLVTAINALRYGKSTISKACSFLWSFSVTGLALAWTMVYTYVKFN